MCINEGSMIEIIRYRLPVYWACALINDDYTGLSEEEIQEIDAFLKKAEARKLWRAVSAMHRGAEFRHGLVEDITGHQWSLNRYENDLLTAGCHRIAYNEMERIAKQLGWV